jgi:hypothetical protein
MLFLVSQYQLTTESVKRHILFILQGYLTAVCFMFFWAKKVLKVKEQ